MLCYVMLCEGSHWFSVDRRVHASADPGGLDASHMPQLGGRVLDARRSLSELGEGHGRLHEVSNRRKKRSDDNSTFFIRFIWLKQK